MYLDMYNKLEVILDELDDIASKMNSDEIDCGSITEAMNSIKAGMDKLTDSEQFKVEHDEYFV